MKRYIKSAFDPDIDLDDMAEAQLDTLSMYINKLRSVHANLCKQFKGHRGDDVIMLDIVSQAGKIVNGLQAEMDDIYQMAYQEDYYEYYKTPKI